MVTVVQRLKELLNQKDEELKNKDKEIAELYLKLEEAQANHTWAKHIVYKEPHTEPNPELPVPRLEIRWTEEEKDSYTVKATYSLVYRHFTGWIVFIPLGLTKSSGSLLQRIVNDKIELPFRDGVHFQNDMKQLNLPGYAICGTQTYKY